MKMNTNKTEELIILAKVVKKIKYLNKNLDQ